MCWLRMEDGRVSHWKALRVGSDQSSIRARVRFEVGINVLATPTVSAETNDGPKQTPLRARMPIVKQWKEEVGSVSLVVIESREPEVAGGRWREHLGRLS